MSAYFFIKADKSVDIFLIRYVGSPKQTFTGQSYNTEEHENCGEDATFWSQTIQVKHLFIVVMASIFPSPLSCLFISIFRRQKLM